ncbi:hypothetical protein GIB67_011423 [Kingdonia uniflora]|uniref:Calponin-homology (CH) domain-containing protein n=1 Tax=Kingdonia uniflora TaxID=39325 RepID=A0A7J7NM71_9MAGN|nr:hypothetical protein GIB67_011423 [Kingdonia uniflora]
MEGDPPSPNPSLFRDISNLKTPNQTNSTTKPSILQSPFPHFFTASKQTPRSSSSSTSTLRHRPRHSLGPASRSKATRRLKAFELEQSQSSRKAQIQKQKSIKSLSKSLTVWLNLLFESPSSCGCGDSLEERVSVLPNGKRDSWEGSGVGIDGPRRSPKRRRDCLWRAGGDVNAVPSVLSISVFSALRGSLQEVCSFEDLKERMRGYLSSESCKEIFTVMTQVVKNIDEGRLKMKAHCPIVTDVGMKGKATRILLCYNPTWLRIGLYIVFGGDSLLPSGDAYSDQELIFLKMVVEKQLFSHAGLVKAYAYNKKVEGLYRPGYFEALGNIILKRFLLLVLVLDRAKSQSILPIKYGIDGIDGGSPLLFVRQPHVKSSRDVIHGFLSSEVMHGEGNLLAHLVIVGYKLSYQQIPLLEYDFRVTELFDDLQDGVRLCRAIQLLKRDTSILMKMVVPSDTHKKNLVNCGVVMELLKQAGVPLSDGDGVLVVAEDVVCGEMELTISLLWNMFIHLQLPLLINKKLLIEEIFKVKGVDVDYLQCNTTSLIELILAWIQAICQKYDLRIETSASLVDGKAMWCLLDYYFRNELSCFKNSQGSDSEDSSLWATNSSDAVHNFVLCQKLTTILGNLPEVLQTSDILEHNGACDERSVIVLLVFLTSQLVGRKNMDQLNIHKLLGCNCQSPEMKRSSLNNPIRKLKAPETCDVLNENNTEDAVRKFKAVQAWWRDMAQHNHNCEIKQTNATYYDVDGKNSSSTQREKAVTIIQSHYRGYIGHRSFLKIKNAASFLQIVIRVWLLMKRTGIAGKLTVSRVEQISFENQKIPETFSSYLIFMIERHNFMRLKTSVLLIQRATRSWITRRNQHRTLMNSEVSAHSDATTSAVIIQSYFRRWRAQRVFVQFVSQLCKTEIMCRKKKMKDIENKAAAKILSHWNGWRTRKNYTSQKKGIVKIQSAIRCLKCLREFQRYRTETRSAIIIQSHFRGLVSRKKVTRERHLIVVIQSNWRRNLKRVDFLHKREAAIKIQSCLRCLKCWKTFQSYKFAATEIQRFSRGQVARSRLLGASSSRSVIHSRSVCQISKINIQSLELRILLDSILKIQRWWKQVLLYKSKRKSAIVIQSCIRGWIGRRKASREKRRIVVIQSYWKGFIARKESREQLLVLRLKLQKSAANVDNGMRLINRLVSALSELLSIRSISSILHTCSTLDFATKHSQKCCETLVSAGAIETLLTLIRSVSRSIPDQEVLKHALSTLRNLTRYPHLAEVLIGINGSVEVIFWEWLRNKEEVYFITSELLKRFCSTKKGVEALQNLPTFLKRLQNLVEELKRKVKLYKRKSRSTPAKELNEKRLKEAVELLKLVMNG